MVKKKAKKAESEPDYEAIGRGIVDAVGMPLEDGITFREVGYYSTKSISASKYYASKEYSDDYDRDLLAKEIANKADELKKAIEEYKAKYNGGFEELIIAAENIRLEFCRLAPMGGLSLMARETPRGAKQLLHHFLQSYFRNFFGVKPSYTYKEEEGYSGPFIRYVRAVRDIAELDITDAALAKALQRTRARHKRIIQKTAADSDIEGTSVKEGAGEVKGQFRRKS